MKNVFLLLFILFQTVFLSAQKVDIDNFRITIQNTELPTNYVSVDDRKFSVKAKGNYSMLGRDKEDAVTIFGWEKVDNDANLDVEINIGQFVRGRANSGNRTDEQKDKAGKVTSRTTKYWVNSTNSISGNVRVFGAKNELPRVLSRKELEKMKEKEEKEAKKKNKKKEEVAENPFLKNVDTNAPESVVEENSTSTKSLAYSYALDKSYEYKTSEYTSPSAANKEYNAEIGRATDGHENDYRNNYPSWVRSYLNNLYGYRPVSHWGKFKRMDSEKHPEFSMFDNATKAMKLILEKMRYNRPINQLEEELKPILSYFEGLDQKYNKDEKQEKRLRGAALYNMARIYQFLDQHEKVIEIGNKIIASEHEEKEGQKFIDESTELKRRLDFHHMTSRHIVPRNASEEKEEEGEKSSEEDIEP